MTHITLGVWIALGSIALIMIALFWWLHFSYSHYQRVRDAAKAHTKNQGTPIAFVFCDGNVEVYVNGESFFVQPDTIHLVDLTRSVTPRWTTKAVHC